MGIRSTGYFNFWWIGNLSRVYFVLRLRLDMIGSSFPMTCSGKTGKKKRIEATKLASQLRYITKLGFHRHKNRPSFSPCTIHLAHSILFCRGLFHGISLSPVCPCFEASISTCRAGIQTVTVKILCQKVMSGREKSTRWASLILLSRSNISLHWWVNT